MDAPRPPWEIAAPQPALRELAESGLIRGRVLDVGCGTGEHALMAAALGCAATGVDRSDAVLEQARTKARERGLGVGFEQRDVLDLAAWGEKFDVVLDSLVFHGFHGEQRRRYVENLGAVLDDGGRLFVLCYAEEPPSRGGPVHRVTAEEIEQAFAEGWRIDAIDAVTIVSALPSLPDGLRGWRTSLTRTARTTRTTSHRADARIPTDRAMRYLDQLCSHLGSLGSLDSMGHRGHGGHGRGGHGHLAPQAVDIERTPDRAVIRFPDGHWDLTADPTGLLLRVEADTASALERLTAAITARIAKIGRRDGLSVTWSGTRTGTRTGTGTGTRTGS